MHGLKQPFHQDAQGPFANTGALGVDLVGSGRHAAIVGRRARLRLVGEDWFAYGGATIPEDRIIEVSEAEAAAFLRRRGSSRQVEFLEWVPDPQESQDQQQDPR